MRRHWWGMSMGLLLLGPLLAGCGITTTKAEQVVNAKPTPTATAKPTPKPTPSPTANTGPFVPCDPQNLGSPLFTTGDIAVTMQLGNLAYPSRKLPDGLALKPYQLPAAPGPTLDQQLSLSPFVNPNLQVPGGGYTLLICNTSSSQPHAINSISLKIMSFTPYSGQLNQWMGASIPDCSSYFVRPQGWQGHGCGGGASDEGPCMQATFTSAANGVVASIAANNQCTNNILLPRKLPPRLAIPIGLGVTTPASAPGTYTFALGISVDNTIAADGYTAVDNPPVFSPGLDPLLLAPIAHKWSGDGCQASAMQAQIPAATNPPTYYVCPEA